MAITPPPELKYGYVVGKIVRTIADDIDADFFPDTVPASGTVSFKPAKSTSTTVNYPAIVLHEPITAIINEGTGEVHASTGALGVWLVTGIYDVVFNLNFGTLNGFQITVTEEHTETKPLDLANSRPLVPDPTTKFVVNEQVYINTIAEADRARTEADRAATEVTRRLNELKNAGELTGPQGPPNTLTMGTVSATTGTPSATITGTSPNQKLNLTLKTGDTGPANSLAIGTVSATTGNPAATITGTAPNQTLNLTLKTGATGSTGAKGDKGDTGDIGPANTLNIGTVTESTTAADASITGTSPNQTLNLTLKTGPQGPKGDKGEKGDTGNITNIPNGTTSELTTGTETANRMWAPKSLTDYVSSRVSGLLSTVVLDNITDLGSFGKTMAQQTTNSSARTALGLSTGATAGAGTASILNTGTSTTNYVWTPKIIADYVKSMVPKDTGWRNISSFFSSEYGTADVRIRRVGDTVTLKYTFTANDNTASGNSQTFIGVENSPITAIGAPSGDVAIMGPLITALMGGTVTMYASGAVSSEGRLFEYAGVSIGQSKKMTSGYREGIWNTETAFPTTLPGTAL